jgi:hypothetical protein
MPLPAIGSRGTSPEYIPVRLRKPGARASPAAFANSTGDDGSDLKSDAVRRYSHLGAESGQAKKKVVGEKGKAGVLDEF